MSWLSDIAGGGAQDAATAQEAGLMAGLDTALPYLNANPGLITQYGGQAQQPFQGNYNAASNGLIGSSGQLRDLLGQNGPQGSQSALTALQTTPGYQFTLGQGDKSINAAAAANGTLNSGNQLTALSNYNQGLASNTYQNAVGNAQNALGQYGSLATQNAGGLAGVLGGESSALTGNNNLLAQLMQSTYSGIGNAQAGADLKQGAANASLLGGAINLGTSLAGSALGGVGGLSGLSGLFGSMGGLGAGLDGAESMGFGFS
jgi:hypothetical protein